MAPSANTVTTESRQKQPQPTPKHGSDAATAAHCTAEAPQGSPVFSSREQIPLKKDELPCTWSCTETSIWVTFLCACGAGYTCLSDGEVSALLTLSAAFFTLSAVFAVYHTRVCGDLTARVVYDKPVSGDVTSVSWLVTLLSGGSLCPKSAGLFAVALLARVTCNLRRPAYLPTDATGDWAYQSMETFSALLLLVAVSVRSVAARRRRSFSAASTKQKGYPTVNEDASVGGCRYVFLAAIVCGLVLKHDINESFAEDFAWSFAMYMETLAFVPFIRHQLVAKRTPTKADDSSLAHDVQLLRQKRYTAKPVLARRLWRQFLFSLVVSRALQLAFWAITFEEFAPGSSAPEEEDIKASGDTAQPRRDGNIRGWFSLAATVAQLAFSLYLLKVYCDTQRHLDRDYSEDQDDQSAPSSAEKTAGTDCTKDPGRPSGPRKRFIAAPGCCGAMADVPSKKQVADAGGKQQ